MPKNELEIVYVEARIKDVIDYYVKGYDFKKKKQEMQSVETFYDSTKGIMVFKFLVKNKEISKKD